MSVRVALHGDILRIDFEGEARLEDFYAVAEATRGIEVELNRCPDRIVDLTGVRSIGVGYAVLSSLAMQRQAERPRNRYRIVFVVNSDVAFGIARIYQSVGEHADITVRNVATLDEAVKALAS